MIHTIVSNGPVISFCQPEWLNGKVRAKVVVGSNHYSDDGDTEESAAENLRNKLKELWQYSEEHKHIHK